MTASSRPLNPLPLCASSLSAPLRLPLSAPLRARNLYSPAGCRATNPASGLGLLLHRGPCPRRALYPVSNRNPAMSINTCPLFAYTVMCFPLPGTPNPRNHPDVSGAFNNPALFSTYDTDPEQS